MNLNEWDFKDLRTKLDVMGYTQTMPVLAMPLVSAIFGDLVKTTECLRDTKNEVGQLLEEKTCWELGVEPYKCDNSRLLAECNELHLQFLKEREDYEQRMCEFERRIRSLQTDKEHLQTHNVQLQSQLDAFISKQLITAATVKRSQHSVYRQGKKPFITTVRSGEVLPPVNSTGSVGSTGLKCTKCNAGVIQKTTTTNKDGVTVTSQTSGPDEFDRLQNELESAGEQLEFYKRKVESRNREIRRLNDLLAGGRPPAALARDCCYKDVGTLSQDIDLLQREKSELMAQVREYQDKMHDAMQRAVRLEAEKQEVEMELEEIKAAALQVEEQANNEVAARDSQLLQLKSEMKLLNQRKGNQTSNVSNDKRQLNEKLNLLTRSEEELQVLNEKLKRKLIKMEGKLQALQKDQKEQQQQSSVTLDEEKIRLKSERDFFQKEYLRLMSKSGSDSEIAFLQSQIKSKDDELQALRSELCMASAVRLNASPRKAMQHCDNLTPPTTCPSMTNSSRSDCVQAAIGRIERERDCARTELERMRCERDTLREKQLSNVQLHAEEVQALRLRNDHLQDRIRQLERDNRLLDTARIPSETQNEMLKEDVAQLKQRLVKLQAETESLRRENEQISMLNDQNERIVADYQAKLILADRQLRQASSTLDSSRETKSNELSQMRSELGIQRQNCKSLEIERDTLQQQLENKTERLYKLEYEIKEGEEKRIALEQKIKELESKVGKLTTRTLQRDSELNETSAESKTMRQQIVALKASRDEAIAENGRLTDKLSDAQVEAKTLQVKLRDAEQQVANMKQKLHKYVQEVKRAEDLLMQKEKDREELLEHYHCLTNDQVVLEGTNQSLEHKADEFKRQICELQCEVHSLKDQIHCRQCKIDELEMQLTAARASNRCLERELDIAREQKIELDIRKELCDKLDVEKEKLNAELNELNEIRKKLEKECEKLRNELQQKSVLNQVTTETTEQLLGRMRGDQQRQDEADLSAKHELERLRQLHETTLAELQEERLRCMQQERLATQFEEQAKELRKNLVEDRFCQARGRAASPKFPPTTL